ncbi:MAG: TOBE domain-containing protein [Candidatus Ranarchaeia archaeon]
MSYRYAWGMLRDIEKRLGLPVVVHARGGTNKGSTKLTPLGEKLLQRYKRLEKYMEDVLRDDELWEAIGLKISARNQIEGQVEDIVFDEVTAKIVIKVDKPTRITAMITREAAEQLGIERGDNVKAVIKATEVMISKFNP